MFIRAGIEINWYYGAYSVGMPLFNHMRVDNATSKIALFGSIKIGYSLYKVNDFYFAIFWL